MSIRQAYIEMGPDPFYMKHGGTYRNPHEPAVRLAIALAAREWGLGIGPVLDLACGSGEATAALALEGIHDVTGLDPYTGHAFEGRIGRRVIEMTFSDIAARGLPLDFDLVVCSYALHLVPDSLLPQLLLRLSTQARLLLVLSPHKRPAIEDGHGWRLLEEAEVDRVRIRLFRSTQSA